eukprot:Selendium_serpulae@DN1026_c0_g1_i1.p1
MTQPDGLADPEHSPDADVVIYDGHCNFCKSQVRLLSRLDCCGNRLAFISLHDARVHDRYPDLTHEMLMEEVYVVDTAERRHAGSNAVRYLTRRLPVLWLFAPVLHLPGTAWLWRWLYSQISKRRYQLAGRSCEGDTCKVHYE